MYQSGIEAKKIITTSRNNVAKFINTDPENIIFTSGGSANNTLFIKGYVVEHRKLLRKLSRIYVLRKVA